MKTLRQCFSCNSEDTQVLSRHLILCINSTTIGFGYHVQHATFENNRFELSLIQVFGILKMLTNFVFPFHTQISLKIVLCTVGICEFLLRTVLFTLTARIRWLQINGTFFYFHLSAIMNIDTNILESSYSRRRSNVIFVGQSVYSVQHHLRFLLKDKKHH